MAVLLAALVIPAAARTAAPTKGEIAYSRYRFVNSPLREEIWIARPDGGDARRVTTAPANYLDGEPDWSPDGSTLVFNRCAPRNGAAGDGRCTVWSVRRDGSDLRQLSPCGANARNLAACPDENHPAFAPDGRRIAFALYDGVPGFGIGDSRLRNVRTFFPFGHVHGAPDIDAVAWSPRGDRLVFTVHNDGSRRFKPVDGRAVFVMSANGTGLRRVTPWRLQADGPLDWSPDGTRILFATITADANIPGGTIGELYTISPDGSALHRLTHLAGAGVGLGSFSPDGRSVVYATTAAATANPVGEYFPDVVTIPAGGGAASHVTRTKNAEGSPDWGR